MNIEYYHAKFEEAFQRVKDGTCEKIDKEQLTKSLDYYKTKFKDDPKYNKFWPSLMKCLEMI